MVDRVSCGSGWSSFAVGRVPSGVVEVTKLVSCSSWESVELYAEKRDGRVVARVLVEKRGCVVVARVLAEKWDMSGFAVLRGKGGSGGSEVVEVLVHRR